MTFTGPDTATSLGYNHEHIHRWESVDGIESAWWTDIAGYYHHDYIREDGRWRICYVRLAIKFFDPDKLYTLLPPRGSDANSKGS